MNSFYEKETALLERWCNSSAYSKEDRDNFCYDGLIYRRDPDCKDEEFAEVRKWEHAKRKVLFFLKDTNDFPNDDGDYRWSYFYDTEELRTYKTFVVLLKWLWALNEVTPENLPEFKNKTREEYISVAQKYPMAIVNVKKIVGGPSVQNKTLWDFFEKDKKFIKEQICDFLKPNIIVCGGGGDTLLKMIMDLYKKMKFEKFNDWCYYCHESNIIIINSYHPSYRCTNKLKFDVMIENVQDMLKKIVKKHSSFSMN